MQLADFDLDKYHEALARVRADVVPDARMVELFRRNKVEFGGYNALYRDPNTDQLSDYKVSANALVDLGVVRRRDLPERAFKDDTFEGLFEWRYTFKVIKLIS
jgi:hypothetical protein